MRPKRVGPYRLIDLLGAGGMGEVYRAYDERLKRWVAVKQVRLDDEDPQRDKRFRREAQATAVVSHPAIVQIHDVLVTHDGEWIVMEYVEGKTLASLLRDGPLTLGRGLPLARQIAEGLAAAHSRGIIHRDLKTENVMVTPAETVKILDFGLAKRFRVDGYDPSEPDTWSSLAGRIVGTSRAMSPEQAQALEVDFRTDLFSFGTLLYETFTGSSPFKGASHIDTLNRVVTHRQPPARELNAGVPRRFSELIDRLLEKDPFLRPGSVDEVVVMLDGIQVEEREITETVPLVPVTPPASPPPHERTRPGRPLPPGTRASARPFRGRLRAALRGLLEVFRSRRRDDRRPALDREPASRLSSGGSRR